MQSVIVQFDTLGGEMVSNAAQNGFGAANKLNNLLMTPLNGLGAAMTSFTAQNLGAGDHARIKKGIGAGAIHRLDDVPHLHRSWTAALARRRVSLYLPLTR